MKEARTSAKAQIASEPGRHTLALGALTAAMQLDLLLFGRDRVGTVLRAAGEEGEPGGAR